MSRGRFAVIVVTLLAAISPLLAQTGRVRVRVTGAGGESLAGADVSLLGADGKAVQTLLSDKDGEAGFQGLPMGENKFLVSTKALSSQQIAVQLEDGNEVNADVMLELSVCSEGCGGPVVAAPIVPGRVHIRVWDTSGHPVANPTVSLLGADHNPQMTVRGNYAGAIVLDHVSMGRHDFLIKGTGFRSETLSGNLSAEGEELSIQAILQLGTSGVFVCSADCAVGVKTISSELVPPQLEPLPIPVHKFYVSGLKE